MWKRTVIAVLATFALSGPAGAQTGPEQKGDTAKPSATQEKKDGAQSRHEHMRDHKQGAPASMPGDADKAKKKKKPLHDHRKEHKQGA